MQIGSQNRPPSLLDATHGPSLLDAMGELPKPPTPPTPSAAEKTLPLSFSSRLMTKLLSNRNIEKKAEEKTDSLPFWKAEPRLPTTFFAKIIAAEICLPIITTIALVESVAYKTLQLLGIQSEKNKALFESSSFTVQWSLTQLVAKNLIYTNLETDEKSARSSESFKQLIGF